MDMKKIIVIIFACILTGGCSSQSKEGEEKQHTSNVKAIETDKTPEVTVMELKPSVFSHEIVSNGKVTAREKVDVNFQTQGIISNIYVRNGQRVGKGQKIATLDTYKLKNQHDKDRNATASARLEMKDVLIGQGYDPEHPENIPEEVMKLARLRSGLEQAELTLAASEKELANATLTAPVGGIIANLSAKPHNMTGSEPLCRIINDGGMDVEFSIIESELSMLKQGDEVSVSPFSDPANQSIGRITEINPMVDENGMIKVWASVEGNKGLIDGMNVRVKVKRKVEESLVVPKTAVVLRSGRQVVFTLKDGKAIWNYVTTGLENLSEYTITEGLEPGAIVIVSGNINLAHEAPVKVLSEN
ncbi:MAG: efflux RND transporter periplasmic adaptor subunit [Muribaculaceae bacterium]|nr:efflux RND transporter periplasmic adaptor subunit [Muribaculaceae bacterium]